MNKNNIIDIFNRFNLKNSHPTTELIYQTPFELLIAAMLSTKSTDIAVNKVTSKLFIIANTPQKILSLNINDIKMHIKSIGLFNIKTKNIIKICNLLLEKHQGLIPENRKSLEELPGVGRKTANVILNTIFGWTTIAVDTHVFRVCNRTKLAIGKNTKEIEKKLLAIVPEKFKLNCHNWLVLHGRYICTAKKPRCKSCLIEDLCEFNDKCKY